MKTYTVYMHVSPSGKVYIGITCQKPEKRWGPDGSGYKHCPHFLTAIKKHGWENFEHVILAEGLPQQEAERLEVELIAQYRATDRCYGYNADAGGSTGCKHTQETKTKIGNANRARVWTEEARQKLRAYKLAHPTTPGAARKIGDANRGRKHRPESVARIKAAHPGKGVINLDTGEAYESLQDAAKATGLDPSHIGAVCRGERKTTGGARWGYAKGVIV